MDDLIGRLVANAGVDRTAAEKAVGVIPQFLMKEGPTEKVRALIPRVPGAETALAHVPENACPGLDPGWEPVFRRGHAPRKESRAHPRSSQSGCALASNSSTRLRSPSVLGAIGFARETAGDDAVGEIVGAIPGLGRFA